ncbi:2-phospho-L-lactate guanylyltransferase [Microbacterium sp. ZW T5_56]|uniref:2-phospho-L-lactate guanylyltransferase n=1 Tax=Microbacterium sp. ZW T5_56 TaxID=3378081 RepID=UPI003853E947
MSVTSRPGWTVIVPVKHTSHGKSRLGADAALARAIALDTLERIAAAHSAERIVLVTSDVGLAEEARREIVGVQLEVVADVDSASTTAGPDSIEHSLNDAVRLGLGRVSDDLVAVIHADLPALDPDELDEVLRLATDVPFGAVSDSEGLGTVMLTAQNPRALHPSFGRRSYARHLAAGAAPLAAAASLRHDIDTPAQLAAARDSPDLTLGPRTRAAGS